MLRATKDQKGNVLKLSLVGEIEENVDFDKLVGPFYGEIHVYCGEVTRINSVGIRAWVKYFQGLTSRGTVVQYHECPVCIIEQLNLIVNFIPPGEIQSAHVPFTCPKCRRETSRVYSTKEIASHAFLKSKDKCQGCGTLLQFDDIVDEYSSFARRPSR